MEIVEKEKRLSESRLWALQYDAYCQYGVEAWSKHGVPSYMTSNAFIAKNYARTVLGFLRDCLGQLDVNHPLYILDLGAGTGRFAYHFLKELLELLLIPAFKGVKICYVMTDIAKANLSFWRQHPYFQEYFNRHILDCAFYHHAQKDPIQLVVQGTILSKSTVVNPLILVCNYFFDTIEQDVFRVKNGRLEEGRVTLCVENAKTSPEEMEKPGVINSLHSSYTYHPIDDVHSYYPEKEFNDLLEIYRQKFESTTFLFPVGALRTLRYFNDNVQSHLMVMAGDQGVCTEKQVRQWEEPKLSLHGSFSLAVSYHAIGAFFELMKGKALMTSFSDPIFVVLAGMLWNKSTSHFPETELAFREHIDSFEPADFWKLVSLSNDEWPSPPLEQILLLIKLGNWDAVSFYAFFSLIREYLPKAAQKEKDRVASVLEKVWDSFFPVAASEGEFILNLGVLLFDIKRYAEAVLFFERSMGISGRNSKALRNMAKCYTQMGDKVSAEKCQQEGNLLGSRSVEAPAPFM